MTTAVSFRAQSKDQKPSYNFEPEVNSCRVFLSRSGMLHHVCVKRAHDYAYRKKSGTGLALTNCPVGAIKEFVRKIRDMTV